MEGKEKRMSADKERGGEKYGRSVEHTAAFPTPPLFLIKSVNVTGRLM